MFVAILACATLAVHVSSHVVLQECRENPCVTMVSAKRCDLSNYCLKQIWTKYDREFDYCSMCEKVAKEAYAFLADSNTRATLRGMITEVCPQVYSPCKQLADEFDQVYDKVLEYLNDTEVACSVFCDSKSSNQQGGALKGLVRTLLRLVAAKVQEEPTCSLCENIIVALRTYFNDESIKRDIMSDLTMVCDVVPGVIRQTCNELLADYGDILYGIFTGLLGDDKYLCSRINLCPAMDIVASKMHIKVVSAEQNSVEDSKVVFNAAVIMPSIKSVRMAEIKPALKEMPHSDVTCVICEFVMNKIEQIIGDDKTEAKVVAALDKVCSILPSTVSAQCKSFVDVYAPAIINLLVAEVNPGVVCTLLKLCNQGPQKVPMQLLKPALPKPLVPKVELLKPALSKQAVGSSDISCDVCKIIMQEVETLVGPEVVKDKVKELLDNLCNRFPSSFQDTCGNFVHANEDAIINWLISGMQPQFICTFLKYC